MMMWLHRGAAAAYFNEGHHKEGSPDNALFDIGATKQGLRHSARQMTQLGLNSVFFVGLCMFEDRKLSTILHALVHTAAV